MTGTALNLRPKLGSAPGQPRIMGILNVTPDSFSDGGLYDSTESAIEHAVRLHDEGADVVVVDLPHLFPAPDVLRPPLLRQRRGQSDCAV